jgi:hypothetical protein
MRFVGWWGVGLALVSPALAPAQAVKRADLIGSWRGNTEYTKSPNKQLRVSVAFEERKAVTWLMLWSDGLWYFEDEGTVSADSIDPSNTTHGHGRWRLVGDTLWLGDDGRYSRRGIFERLATPDMDSMDTLKMRGFPNDFPKNDSLFWTADRKGAIEEGYKQEEIARGRFNYYWHLVAYKASLSGRKLSLVRLDSLSTSTWLPAKWMVEYRGKNARPPINGTHGFWTTFGLGGS